VTTNESSTLDQLAVGRSATIQSIGVDADKAAKLMEMGMLPGTQVRVARVAPLGDPIDITVRGYHLSLRKTDAKKITIVPDQHEGAPR